jgi:hypothetical protein
MRGRGPRGLAPASFQRDLLERGAVSLAVHPVDPGSRVTLPIVFVR